MFSIFRLPFVRKPLFGLASALGIILPASGQLDRAPILDTVDRSYILVAAHRCGYMSNGAVILPENSIPAMNYSVALGVDILETDIRMTLDGELVLMHDSSVDRTTNGSGAVSSLTLAQIKALRLKGPGGVITTEQVPTLEEIMLFAKAHGLLVSLDKYLISNIAIRDEIMAVLIATDTVDRAILKGFDSAADVAAMRAAYPDHAFHYMPTLSNQSEATMISALTSHNPSAIELIFSSDTTPMLSANSVAKTVELDTHIWINSLWSSLCGGHTDAVALGGNPDGSWGWIIDKGATMIDTDNPAQLIPYLDSLGLHGSPAPPPPPAPGYRFDFDDGTMQEWTNTHSGGAGENPNRFEARLDQGKGGGHTGDYSLLHDGAGTWLDGRDVAHDSLVASSPPFVFNPQYSDQWAISFHLLGGTGTAATPASLGTLPASTATGGFMGVALRRVSDGAYLLIDRRDVASQISDWEEQGWTTAAIAAAIAADAPDETYQLDLIDQFHGAWGWIILDSVTITGVRTPDVGLLSAPDPLITPAHQFLAIDNPLTDDPGDPGDIVASSGSLFLYGEVLHSSSWCVLGLFPEDSSSSGNGAVDFGRNSGSSGFAIFDYLDHKGAGSATARTGGDPVVSINGGRYTIITEIRFDSSNSGTLRGWVFDGVNGSLDLASPNAETTFSSGFSTAPDELFVRAASGSTATWTNLRAVWADGITTTRSEAFAMLEPERPFVYLTVTDNNGGEFGADTRVAFSLTRTGGASAPLTIPITFSGTATPGDDYPAPASVVFPVGVTTVELPLDISPDDLAEGNETIIATILDNYNVRVGSLNSPTATVADSPFGTWILQQLGDSPLTLPHDDAEGDGGANLLEYFAGSDPGDPASKPLCETVGFVGDDLVVHYHRALDRPDVTGTLQWSPDLARWFASGGNDGTRTIDVLESVVSAPGSDPGTIEAIFQTSSGPVPMALFVRLVVQGS